MASEEDIPQWKEELKQQQRQEEEAEEEEEEVVVVDGGGGDEEEEQRGHDDNGHNDNDGDDDGRDSRSTGGSGNSGNGNVNTSGGRATGASLSPAARQEGFPAEAMFLGDQDHPTYDSSTGGQADEDRNWSDLENSEPDGERAGAAAAARSGEEAAAAVALEGSVEGQEEEEEGEEEEEEEEGGEEGVLEEYKEFHSKVAAVAPSWSDGLGWNTDSVAAVASSSSIGGGEVAEAEAEAEGGGGGAGRGGGNAGTAGKHSASSDLGSRLSQHGKGKGGSGGGGGGREDGGGSGQIADMTPPRAPFHDFGDSEEGDGSPLMMAPSEIMRHIPTVPAGRDREAQAVIDSLQEVYRKSLKPIEQLSLFDKFHHDVMTDADLQAKPQVLLLGQGGTGKTSMIRHFIGRDFPGMHIGPDAGPGVFQVVMAGSAERTVKGSALCILDELPYAGLGKFGAPFLGKFQASIVPSPLLDHLSFVDTPGILAADKFGTRGYPFPEVVKWFADRSDLILVVFDAHKLDMGEEFREVMSAVVEHGDRVRVVLNKAQEVDGDRLLKVYGALMWSIGRCLRGKTGVPKVYVGSFWDGPRRHPDDRPEDADGSFDADEAALRREMMDLPKNVGVRKINDLMQRARLVRIHVQIIYAVTSRMPRIWGAEAAQDRILASLEEIFEEVKVKGELNQADMPDVEEYRRELSRIDFRTLPRRNRRLLDTLDDIVERDIKQCVTRAGGVRRIYKLDSAAKIMDNFGGSTSGRRRRATMGGRPQDVDYPGAGLFNLSRRNSVSTGIESPGGSEDHDDDSSTSSEIDGRRAATATAELPYTAWSLVLVALVGIVVALWATENVPVMPGWASPLKPGPIPMRATKDFAVDAPVEAASDSDTIHTS